MRFRTIAAATALLNVTLSAAAGDPLPWEKIFGGGKDDLLLAIVALPDNGYAAAGMTKSKGAGKEDLWALRVDAKGNVLWEKTFGGSQEDGATHNPLVALPDGGFALAGATISKGAGEGDAWVLRLDANGEVVADFYLFVMLLWAAKNKIAMPQPLKAFSDHTRTRPTVQVALRREGLIA